MKKLLSFMLSVAAIVAAFQKLGLHFPQWPASACTVEYTTALGQEKQVMLGDGSSADLNTNTRLKVCFSAKTRYMELVRGEAVFTVFKEDPRPFVVASNHLWVRDISTKFDMYREADQEETRITDLQGNIDVLRAPSFLMPSWLRANTTLHMATGQQVEIATIDGSVDVRPRTLERLEIEHLTAWTEGWIMFHGESLANVTREVKRYMPVTFVYSPDLLSGRGIGLSMRTSHIEDLLVLLKDVYNVESNVGTTPDGTKVINLSPLKSKNLIGPAKPRPKSDYRQQGK